MRCSRSTADRPRGSLGAENRQLYFNALVLPVVEAGGGAYELFVDLADVAEWRVLKRAQVGGIGVVVPAKHVVVLISLRRNPTRVANEPADLTLVELVSGAGG